MESPQKIVRDNSRRFYRGVGRSVTEIFFFILRKRAILARTWKTQFFLCF
jgi:hypothetical protein